MLGRSPRLESTPDLPRIESAQDILESMGEVLSSLSRAVAGNTRDWSVDKRDAWVWGVLCGWVDRTDLPAMAEIITAHNLDAAAVENMKRLHSLVVRAVDAHRAKERREYAALEREKKRAGEFQRNVDAWARDACCDIHTTQEEYTRERTHRFVEEALELAQSMGCSATEAQELLTYVFNRPVGEPGQEVGGTMTTLAALCASAGLDMAAEGSKELSRISHPDVKEKIRLKRANKPKDSPLPQHVENDSPPSPTA